MATSVVGTWNIFRRWPGENPKRTRSAGIGNCTREQIVTALQTGKRPDGRILAPIMPWHAFANLTREDATAIATFIQSLPPVKHDVPGPFKPGEKIKLFVMRILPPGETVAAAPQ